MANDPYRLVDHLHGHQTTPQGTILVVEDEEFQRRMIMQTLKANFSNVRSTRDAEHALKYVGDAVSVVVTDLNMGDQSGIDLLNRWKEATEGKMPVFIFVTGERDLSSAVEAMKQGAFDYLSKPIDLDKLLTAVQKALAAA